MSELDNIIYGMANSRGGWIGDIKVYSPLIDVKEQREAARELSELRAEVKRLKAEREWQPIESAPKDETEILILSRHIGETEYSVDIGHLVTGHRPKFWFIPVTEEFIDAIEFGGWQPLPRPEPNVTRSQKENGRPEPIEHPAVVVKNYGAEMNYKRRRNR